MTYHRSTRLSYARVLVIQVSEWSCARDGQSNRNRSRFLNMTGFSCVSPRPEHSAVSGKPTEHCDLFSGTNEVSLRLGSLLRLIGVEEGSGLHKERLVYGGRA